MQASQIGTISSKSSSFETVKNAPSSRPLKTRKLVQKIFNVQTVTSSSLRQRNVILISKEDFESFWGSSSSSSKEPSGYLLIADEVYQASVGSIKRGWIAISDFHMPHLESATMIGSKLQKSIVANPFDPKKNKTIPLEKIVFNISENSLLIDSDEKIVLSSEQLKKQLKSLLKKEFLVKNKSFVIGFPWGEISGEINSLSPPNYYEKGSLVYGVINEKTKLCLSPTAIGNIAIVEDIFSDEVRLFEFRIELKARFFSASGTAQPLILSADMIKEHIQKELLGKLICKGAKVLIPHPSGWDILVRLVRCEIDEKSIQEKKERLKEEDLEDGFVIKANSKILLTSKSSQALLTKGVPESPQEITFKVSDIPGAATHPTIDLSRERWIDVEELKSYLKSRSSPFILEEVFEADLSSGTYLIKVAHVRGSRKKSQADVDDYEQSWKIDEKTEIEIEAEEDLEVNLIENQEITVLENASFLITPVKIPEGGLIISSSKLQSFIEAQGPKRLIKNQSFEIVTETESRVELKLIERDFSAQLGFCIINEKTALHFASPSNGKVKVVGTVYDKEIQKMRFSLSAVRRKSVESYARTPLIVDYEAVVGEIRKELKKHKFVLEGYQFKLPYGDGWDINIKFQKGVLNNQLVNTLEESRLVNTSSKKGFSILEETPIEFVSGIKDALLVKGSFLTASLINFKLIEIIENYNKDNDTFVKGNWINLEELKLALQESNTLFIKKQKIVVELESGKFLLEVALTKGKDLENIPLKEAKYLQWDLQDSTKIHLSIDKKFDLQTVKRAEPCPLKRIEFSVYPEETASGHLSLKDEEIIHSLKELFPLRLIKSNVLSLQTESSSVLRLDIQEMLPVKGTKYDAPDIFGLVTEETEIVLTGKEKAKLAIRKSPKILEMEDPVKYLENLGIGGIDEQFKQIFRIFFSRSENLEDEVARRGIKPIKGILLYGPPGTGKTTLARHIGEMLGCSGEMLQMSTATEVFNMWFGGSEAIIRKMFEPARKAQENYKEKSPLYILIIDEIDALLPKRGSSVGTTKDGLVNQFLAEMDGLKELKNILVIGLTNRKEQIDEAALRPGRFDVHVKIDLPNVKGREKIFEIHTKTLQEEGLLDESVDLKALAEKTQKYSGASIEGLVKEASYYSLERLHKLKCSKEEKKNHSQGKVTMKDFEKVLRERGKEEDQMPEYVRFSMYH